MVNIEITNFQSIAYIKFSFEGFCTLVGKNFIGKSAVLRAINAALTNPSGTNFIRWGEKYCEVRIKTDTADVLWHKEQSNNFYVINNVRYDKIGKDASAPFKVLENLGLGLNNVGNENVNLLYASQFTPLFLVDKRDAKSADLLTAVYGLDRLYKAIDLCNKDQKVNSDLLKLRKKDVEIYKQDLDRFVGFDEILKCRDEVVSQKKYIDLLEQEIIRLDGYITRAVALSIDIKKIDNIKNIEIPEIDDLKNTVHELGKIEVYCDKISGLYLSTEKLKGIQNISISEDISKEVSKIIKDIEKIDSYIVRYIKIKEDIDRLTKIDSIVYPEKDDFKYDDIDYIEKSIKSLVALKSDYLKLDEELKDVQGKLNEALEAKKEFKGLCPLCGNKLKEKQ